MNRLVLIASLLLVGFDCSQPKQATPGPVLVEVDARLRALGEHPVGTEAGVLFEKKGELLLSTKRNAEAKAAFLDAARAYGQSPEASREPVERAERARKRAEAITP